MVVAAFVPAPVEIRVNHLKKSVFERISRINNKEADMRSRLFVSTGFANYRDWFRAGILIAFIVVVLWTILGGRAKDLDNREGQARHKQDFGTVGR